MFNSKVSLVSSAVLATLMLFSQHANAQFVKSDTTAVKMLSAMHNEKRVTIPSGTRIEKVMQIFRNANAPIMVSKNLDLTALRYTGPDINSANLIEALQVVTGMTAIDYNVSHRSGLITLSSADFHNYAIAPSVSQEGIAWMVRAAKVMASVNYLDSSMEPRSLFFGAVIYDEPTNNIRVAAPYHVRFKIAQMISMYVSHITDSGAIGVLHKAGGITLPTLLASSNTIENVKIGTIAKPVKFD